MKKVYKLVVLMSALVFALTACGGGSTGVPAASEVPATEVPATGVPAATEVPAAEVPAAGVPAAEAPATEVLEGAGLAISLGDLSAEPLFVDWTQDGVPMQLIARIDGAGEAQLAYNTCQVCAGSPYAYFEYDGGALVCQNCGNRFALSSVGKVAGGCNPKPVEGYEIEGDSIVVPERELMAAAASFKNWKVF